MYINMTWVQLLSVYSSLIKALWSFGITFDRTHWDPKYGRACLTFTIIIHKCSFILELYYSAILNIVYTTKPLYITNSKYISVTCHGVALIFWLILLYKYRKCIGCKEINLHDQRRLYFKTSYNISKNHLFSNKWQMLLNICYDAIYE